MVLVDVIGCSSFTWFLKQMSDLGFVFVVLVWNIVLPHVQWIFWVGPFLGAAIAAAYHQYVLRAGRFNSLG